MRKISSEKCEIERNLILSVVRGTHTHTECNAFTISTKRISRHFSLFCRFHNNATKRKKSAIKQSDANKDMIALNEFFLSFFENIPEHKSGREKKKMRETKRERDRSVQRNLKCINFHIDTSNTNQIAFLCAFAAYNNLRC